MSDVQVIPDIVSDSDSDSEEDVDSGIADEPTAESAKVDCMDLSDFFSYW